ncbi:MAG: Sua5/YciO/YrdC/YwlC family protein, partial [Planctomycetota bacterium]
IAEAVLRGVSVPVIASSANRAGAAPPQTGVEAKRNLDGQVDLLIDAGHTRFAKASTIVRVTNRSYEVLREGVLDARIIERMAILRILFVCTGNTCRSPMAAGLARKMLAGRIGCAVVDLPVRGVLVESAGTSGGVGRASTEAVAAMERRGVDLSDHSSSSLKVEMLQQSDYVFAMTRSHRETALAMVPSAADRIHLLIDEEDIQDPMGSSIQEYDVCAEKIAKGLEKRMREITL